MEDDVVVTLMTGEGSTQRRQLNARRGNRVAVGSCPCVECEVDLVIGARPGAWFKGVVTVYADQWRLDNLSLDAEVWLVDLENPDLKVSATPGRRQMVAPFEFTDLTFRVGRCDAGEHVTVIGPEVVAEGVPAACRFSTAPLAKIDLRPGTTYMAVLEALCAGVTEAGYTPSSETVSQRLRRQGLRITPQGCRPSRGLPVPKVLPR